MVSEQISFQELKTKHLGTGLVDRVHITKDKSQHFVGVYMKELSAFDNSTITKYKYYFYISNADAFEAKLEEAQKELYIHPRDFVPVIYNTEFPIRLFEFVNVLFMAISIYLYLLFKGETGIFGFLKPRITTMDKKSKNKVVISSASI